MKKNNAIYVPQDTYEDLQAGYFPEWVVPEELYMSACNQRLPMADFLTLEVYNRNNQRDKPIKCNYKAHLSCEYTGASLGFFVNRLVLTLMPCGMGVL